MTIKSLREFREFCAGYPVVGVLEWLDDEIDYYEALADVARIRQSLDEEFWNE